MRVSLLTCQGHFPPSVLLAAASPIHKRMAVQPYAVAAMRIPPPSTPAPATGTILRKMPSPNSKNCSANGFLSAIVYGSLHCGHVIILLGSGVPVTRFDRIQVSRHDSCAIKLHLHGCTHLFEVSVAASPSSPSEHIQQVRFLISFTVTDFSKRLGACADACRLLTTFASDGIGRGGDLGGDGSRLSTRL
jgi:hypothetical protein